MARGKNLLTFRVNDEIKNAFIDIQQASGMIEFDELFEKCIMFLIENDFMKGMSDVNTAWANAQSRKDIENKIKQIALITGSSPSESDHIELSELCDKHGLSFDEIVSEAEKQNKALRGIRKEFSEMSDTEKLIIEFMSKEEEGTWFSRSIIVDMCKRKLGVSSKTVDRAKSNLDLDSKRISGTKNTAWKIPKPKTDQDNESDVSEMEWLVSENVSQ